MVLVPFCGLRRLHVGFQSLKSLILGFANEVVRVASMAVPDPSVDMARRLVCLDLQLPPVSYVALEIWQLRDVRRGHEVLKYAASACHGALTISVYMRMPNWSNSL